MSARKVDPAHLSWIVAWYLTLPPGHPTRAHRLPEIMRRVVRERAGMQGVQS